MGNDRSRLTTDLARTLRRDWTARELDEIGLIQDPEQPIVRHGSLAAQHGEELRARQRQRRGSIARGEIVAEHFDDERHITSPLAGVDQPEPLDTSEIALGPGEWIGDGDRSSDKIMKIKN